MAYLFPRLQQRVDVKTPVTTLADIFGSFSEKVLSFFERVRSIGSADFLDDHEKRKLGIFNQLNFFQLITGIIIPVAELFSANKFPSESWPIASLPSIVSLFVLLLNSRRRHMTALLLYFILSPIVTCVIYINGMNLGIELSFILYGILAVFFLQETGYMLFAVSLSMTSYFMLSVTLKKYPYELETASPLLYMINQGLSIVYIFYGLHLVKQENGIYQRSILSQNELLNNKNLEIQQQEKEISEKASLLEKQAAALEELNTVQTKLFSVISHDLKSPMYALRNLFIDIQKQELSPAEMKEMLPDVISDLNYTTGLMDNLLQWAKCQMQADPVRPSAVDMNTMVNEVIRLFHLQSAAKKIRIEKKTGPSCHIVADKDMIGLVLRNLLSNAIKFTPVGGLITIGVHESSSCAEIYVQDSGKGISRTEMKKINENNFYTTNGTSSEPGTGLGLMLCKEFLAKNGGRMMIESEPGAGSTFSFTLPLADRN